MVSMHRSACALAALLSMPTASAEVRIVGAAPGDAPTIQVAIDLAADEDILLVRPGTYAAFTIDDKSLTIAGLRPGTVTIQGTVEVRNLAAARHVVLADLAVTAPAAGPSSIGAPGLRLVGNAGAVRVQAATLRGGVGSSSGFAFGPGGTGAIVESCPDVAFVDSTLTGGVGGGSLSQCEECWGGKGGTGLATAVSEVALYDCNVEGGRGGDAGNMGGDGGIATKVASGALFASRCTLRGGEGGKIWDFLASSGGIGGDGLVVEAGASAKLLSSATLGGAGGECYLCDPIYAPAGQPTSGAGSFQDLAGTARRFATRALAASAGSLTIEVDGAPGDGVFLTGGFPDFRFKWGWHGVWLVTFPGVLSTTPIGTIGSSGTAVFSVTLPPLPAGTDARQIFLQGAVVDLEGKTFIASPLSVARLDCATLLPDCDGDGAFDGCETAFGSIVDLNANGIEDACEPDCNRNGIVDSFDVSSHTSSDLNANLVPDECEPARATWYVDPAAAPGGDGSGASPFRTLSEASFAALGGHTIVLRDGTYTGSANRNFLFNGRDVVIRSENGPGACVIDLQSQGRAFVLSNGEGPAARVEGLRIRKGFASTALNGSSLGGAIKITSASPTITGCVFEQNTTNLGGALHLTNSSSRVEGCTFRQNSVSASFGRGGAAYATGSGVPRFVACTFTQNTAFDGGALALGTTGTGMTVSHCVFEGNSATARGGAFNLEQGSALVTSSLFADNRASGPSGAGGAIAIDFGALAGITDCTLARNSATARGGAIEAQFQAGATLRNSILWGGASALGPELYLGGGGTGGAQVIVAWCDVAGGSPGVFVDTNATLTWGTGNQDLAPQFVDPDGADGDPLTLGDNDWRLAATSPCVDAGSNALVATDWGDVDLDGNTVEIVPLDLDLAPRFTDIAGVPDTGSGSAPIVDIGCYERQR